MSQPSAPAGHLFWSRGETAPASAPKPITVEQAAVITQEPRAGSSAWNAAGTWEEKNHSAWATARLKELLCGLSADVAGHPGTQVVTGAVTKAEGEAAVVSVRGKPRAVFDYEVAVELTAMLRDTPVKGTLSVHDASRQAVLDGELELEASFDKASLKAAAASDAEARALTAAAKALAAPLLKALGVLDAELGARVPSG